MPGYLGKIFPSSSCSISDEAVIGCDLLLPGIVSSSAGAGMELVWGSEGLGISIRLKTREKWRRQNVLSRRNIAFEEKFVLFSVCIKALVLAGMFWHWF